MTEKPPPQKIPLIFFRSGNGTEPVREWLKELPEAERHAVGKDLLRAQWRCQSECLFAGRWAAVFGKSAPICRTKRTARVMLCLYHEHLAALHGFIKRTRVTPDEDLALARKRQKELMR